MIEGMMSYLILLATEYAGEITSSTNIQVYDKLTLKQGFHVHSLPTIITTINGVPFDTTISRMNIRTHHSVFYLKGNSKSNSDTNVIKQIDEYKFGETNTTDIVSKSDSLSFSVIQNAKKEILIYPNPANSYIRFQNLPEDTQNICITDIYGRLIKNTKGTTSILYI